MDARLPPDDAADLIQEAPRGRSASALLALLDEPTRKEVTALLAYAEDEAGGLMNPRYARLRPDMTVDEAISYLRKQARERTRDHLLRLRARRRAAPARRGVVPRAVRRAGPTSASRDIMRTQVITVREDMDQEAVSRAFAQSA